MSSKIADIEEEKEARRDAERMKKENNKKNDAEVISQKTSVAESEFLWMFTRTTMVTLRNYRIVYKR